MGAVRAESAAVAAAEKIHDAMMWARWTIAEATAIIKGAARDAKQEKRVYEVAATAAAEAKAAVGPIAEELQNQASEADIQAAGAAAAAARARSAVAVVVGNHSKQLHPF